MTREEAKKEGFKWVVVVGVGLSGINRDCFSLATDKTEAVIQVANRCFNNDVCWIYSVEAL